MNTIKMNNTNTGTLSIERYMCLSDSEKNNIQSVKIIPPHLDNTNNKDFGRILVLYKVPVYRMDGIF